jgi:hypothetical protein
VSGRSNKETSLYPGYVVYVEASQIYAVDAVIVPGFPHVFLVDCLYQMDCDINYVSNDSNGRELWREWRELNRTKQSESLVVVSNAGWHSTRRRRTASIGINYFSLSS